MASQFLETPLPSVMLERELPFRRIRRCSGCPHNHTHPSDTLRSFQFHLRHTILTSPLSKEKRFPSWCGRGGDCFDVGFYIQWVPEIESDLERAKFIDKTTRFSLALCNPLLGKGRSSLDCQRCSLLHAKLLFPLSKPHA